MRCIQRFSIGLAVVMLIWPLFVWWNMSHRIVSQRTVFDVGLALVVVACILNGLLRVLIGSVLGSAIGVEIFTPAIGNGFDEHKFAIGGLVGGAVVGAILGYLWHHWTSSGSDLPP